MTRNETRKKKAGQRRKMIAALSLIAVGLVLVITALIMEASHYPWGILFGTATQNADVIPEPAPIILDPEDQDIDITEEIPTADASQEVSAEASAGEASPSAETPLPGNEEDTANAPAATNFVILGTLKIPVLNVSQNLLEGAGKQMKYGVGHIPSTAAPGQKGNCAVSGHRPYPFRYLDQLKSGDSIVIKTGGVTYTYEVYESFDVLPTEVWVLGSIPGEDYTLTVITCTPYMVSSHRLIVRARLTDIDGQAPQAYYGEISPETAESPTASAEPVSPDTSDTPTEAAAATGETGDPFATPTGTETAAPSSDAAPSDVMPVVPD